ASAIVLVARRRDRLEQLENELIARDPNLSVHIFSADLSKQEEIDRLCDELDRQNITINFLINNAGFGDYGQFAESDPQAVHDMLAVNIVALTSLTRRLLPPMIASKRGGILNVSSIASFMPIAGFNVYAASKAYVTSFSEALRSELRGSGVTVTTLCPGPVHTEFGEVAKRPNERKNTAPEFFHVAVEEVARAGLAAVENDRALIISGLLVRVAMGFARMLPLSFFRLAARFAQ
ncbi:MAG: SDR family NAD(P)-dependent oxidoreductase, partial [Verrucomicrobiota bacterium]|nr:SDR family NAD(P)-dependent oxidoreductase [Verrucomicrobiota bacterium]